MDTKLVLLFLMYIQPGYLLNFSKFFVNNERKCNKLLQQPHYYDHLVTGHLWREYYSWNVIAQTCQMTEFLVVTPKIINRFETKMVDFLRTKINWHKATMLAKNGKYEMLMFHDEGPPGSINGIPYLARFGDSFKYAQYEVEPMKFAMKLFRRNKFLVMLDCTGGLGHVMAKATDTVKESEIRSVAEEVNIGKGYIGCLSWIAKE